MAFRLEDFKKTTRKGAVGAPAAVYPHQIKDKKAMARLDIAIRTFDGSVGRRRRDMDAQAMTDFFGDPRLARGMVACLGQFYTYETPEFRHLVGRDAAARLHSAGLLKPVDIRALTYAVVNARWGGFLREADRAACYEELGDRFCLTAQQWDALLHSDAEDNQILTRHGARPAPADIVALYNFHSLDTLLRRASRVVLTGLSLPTPAAADVRALARALGLKAVLTADNTLLTLTEEPAALPSPLPSPSLSRKEAGGLGSGLGGVPRAGRLGRCLLHLIAAYATRATGGVVEAKLGPKAFRLSLTPEMLRALGMPAARSLQSAEAPSFRRRFEAGAALHKDLLKELQKRRARGESGGWRVKRLPEPVVSATGIALPDFRFWKEDTRLTVHLTPAPPELTGGTGEPLYLPPGRKPLEAAGVLAQAETRTHSLFALPEAAMPPPVPADVLALCDRAASEGLVKAADARRTLHLLDESPLIEWVRQAADPRVRYIPGIGLCSQAMVSAIREE